MKGDNEVHSSVFVLPPLVQDQIGTDYRRPPTGIHKGGIDHGASWVTLKGKGGGLSEGKQKAASEGGRGGCVGGS